MPSDPWTRAARQLQQTWPAVLAGDVDAVHKARVATRRLREALPVLEGDRGARRLRKDLRGLTRVLGPIRELDVTIGLVVRLLHDEPSMETALEPMRVHLMEARIRRRFELLQRVDEVDVAGIVARVRKLSTAAPDLVPAPRHVNRDEVGRRIAGRTAALCDAVDDAGALYAPEPLHAVRIAVKKLRYALEVARTARIPGAAKQAARLKRFQDLLGEWHDWQVLADHAARVQASLPVEDVRMAEFTTLVAHVEDRCRALHADFLMRRSDLLSLVSDIETAFAEHSDVTNEP